MKVYHCDENFMNLINVNSLNLWVRHFPVFAESIALKCYSYWEQNTDNDGSVVDDAENVHTNENSFNICGLMGVTVYEITRWGSGPDGEEPNCPRRLMNYPKQRSVCCGHEKFHGLSMLTISHPNGMSVVIGIVSTRN